MLVAAQLAYVPDCRTVFRGSYRVRGNASGRHRDHKITSFVDFSKAYEMHNSPAGVTTAICVD